MYSVCSFPSGTDTVETWKLESWRTLTILWERVVRALSNSITRYFMPDIFETSNLLNGSRCQLAFDETMAGGVVDDDAIYRNILRGIVSNLEQWPLQKYDD
jgi:hypothetical protein